MMYNITHMFITFVWFATGVPSQYIFLFFFFYALCSETAMCVLLVTHVL